MKIRLFLLYIITTFSILLLLGCTKGINNNLVESNPRIITHAMGETEVPYNPRRVITLTNEATEAMLVLDIQPIGAVKSFKNGEWWYSHIKNQMTGVNEVGMKNDVKLDKIASLKPDLIIGSKSLHKSIYEDLTKIAPTIFTENTDGEFKGNLNLYGQAVNKEAQMSEVIINYNSRARIVRELANSENLLDKTISVIGFFPEDTYLFHQSSFIGNIIDDIQLKHTEYKKQSNQQDFVVITKEDFIKIAESSNIILHFSSDSTSKQREREWFSDPIITNLTGTLEKIYEVNPEIYYSSNGILAANAVIDELEYNFKNYRSSKQ